MCVTCLLGCHGSVKYCKVSEKEGGSDDCMQSSCGGGFSFNFLSLRHHIITLAWMNLWSHGNMLH